SGTKDPALRPTSTGPGTGFATNRVTREGANRVSVNCSAHDSRVPPHRNDDKRSLPWLSQKVTNGRRRITIRFDGCHNAEDAEWDHAAGHGTQNSYGVRFGSGARGQRTGGRSASGGAAGVWVVLARLPLSSRPGASDLRRELRY